MQDNFPRLHSLSTVCLLKHYNQDYLLHSLRTDFTGSNGVGKSIIADLFQIIFVGDPAHIKFGTDGIDAKGRKIEKLPYASNIGYAFFHVEVAQHQFITIGAAIFARTHHVITPFLITATMDLQQGKPDIYAFGPEKLLFSKDFLTKDRTPFALDEMAINVLDNYGLYMHKFSAKDERIQYYDWLYNNGLLPVKLSNAGTLKSFAKVIQSFSKSKSLEVNSSKELIHYLFDDDEAAINKEYEEQENTIRRLLQDFKMARQQTEALVSKQKDLLLLKKQEQEKQDNAFQWRQGAYVDAWQKLRAGKDLLKKAALAVSNMENDQAKRLEKGIQVKRLLLMAETTAKLAEKRLNALSDNESLFEQLETLQKKEALLRAIDLKGLMKQSTDQVRLLDKDVDYYIQRIEDSRHVLTRYHTLEHMTRIKEEQDEWLYNKTVAVRGAISDLQKFQQSLAKVEQHDLFTNAFKTRKKLNKAEQAVLFHLKGVLLSKPHQPQPGMRYTNSADLLQELSITRDTEQNGWWIQTGPLFEFVPAASLHLPDIESMEFNSIEEVKQYLHQLMEGLEKQKKVYEDLGKGIKAEGFTEYEFDIALSDNTRLKIHTEAAWLCNIVDLKINQLLELQKATRSKIKMAKEDAEIIDDNFDYDALFLKYKTRNTICQKRFGNLKNYDAEIKIRLEVIAGALPDLRHALLLEQERFDKAECHYNECKERFEVSYPEYPSPITDNHMMERYDLVVLQQNAETASRNYGANYISIIGHYEETRNRVNVLVNEQLDQTTYSFVILERALLGNKIGALDQVAGHLHDLHIQLLRIIEELVKSLSSVFRKTEECYDNYKGYIDSLNRFFHERLISGRFYFTIEFEVNPSLDIRWIEHMRRSFDKSAAEQVHEDLDPGRFIEEFYMKYAKAKKITPLHDLLNPKKYFILRVKLTDENNKAIPGSTGESYTAIALLGIARLSIVQDGNRPGLRFIILEESATLDNVNFNMFPLIAKQYGYQIVTMTPKPYSIGGEEGWYIHNLLGGKENKDINYPEVFSVFRTPKENIRLDMYLTGKRNELADL